MTPIAYVSRLEDQLRELREAVIHYIDLREDYSNYEEEAFEKLKELVGRK